jgi:uncharacterized protein YdhG (YjbR/CyaY superfamily)
VDREAETVSAGARPKTVAEYLRTAPAAAQPHLKRLRAVLRAAAPKATETLKWGNPFFVEPRFVFAYSAHKAHLSFAPGTGVLAGFRDELAPHQSTTHFLKVRYADPLPEELIRRIAERSVAAVAARADDKFW